MFVCAKAYPDNAPYERNKRVKSRGTDHKDTGNLKTKGKKRHKDIPFAIKAETDVSRAQYKRMALACQSEHSRSKPNGEMNARKFCFN